MGVDGAAGLYFLTGLSFFTLGLAVAVHWRAESGFRLAGSLGFLAAFGMLYGFAAWGKLFIPLQVPNFGQAAQWKLLALQHLLEAAAYFALFLFAAKLVHDTRLNNAWLLALPFLLFFPWLAAFIARVVRPAAAADLWLCHWLVLARLALGVPAAALAGYALWLQAKQLAGLRNQVVKTVLPIAVAAFFLFAASTLGQALVAWLPIMGPVVAWLERTAGLRLELLATVVSFLLAFALVRLLVIFDLERQASLEASRQQQAILLERDRISRDLHDGVLQSIYGVGLTLKMCTGLQDVATIHRHLHDCLARLNETVHNIRRFIEGSYSTGGSRTLKELLLAIVAEARALGQASVSLVWEGEEELGLAEASATHIYFLVREAVTNALRHGKASVIELRVNWQADRLTVEVRDNGRGFDPAGLAREKVRGLRFMQERAALLHGSLVVEAAPERGTSVKVILPRAALGQ